MSTLKTNNIRIKTTFAPNILVKELLDAIYYGLADDRDPSKIKFNAVDYDYLKHFEWYLSYPSECLGMVHQIPNEKERYEILTQDELLKMLEDTEARLTNTIEMVKEGNQYTIKKRYSSMKLQK